MPTRGYPTSGSQLGVYPETGTKYGGYPSSNSGGYTPPAYPSFLNTTGGAFYWADDISDPSTWSPRFDSISAGAMSGINTTLTTDWVQPEGSSKCMRLDSAASAYLRNDNLAAMAVADDAPLTFSLGYQSVSINAANTLVSWSSSSSTTPKRVLLYTTGPYRWTQQATTSVFTYSGASNALQHMLVFRQVNNAPGTTANVTRDVENDPAGGLTMDVGSQAVDRFTIGAQWNGAGGPVNFANLRVKWFLILPSGVTLTTAQEVELHNWVMGAYNEAPLYTDSTQYLLLLLAGQSNCACQGIATGAVAGMPDASVKTWFRALNNDAYDPIARAALDRRPGANSYSSYAQYMPTGTFQVPHHMVGVGQGATAISAWLASSTLDGLYSTRLHSELRRAILMSKARFGGNPIILFDWNQGENDAAAGAVVAAAYQASLTTLEAEMRTVVNTAWGDSTFPFHVLQLSDSQTGGGIVGADRDTIQAGVTAWAGGAANRYESNTDSVTQMLPDNLHFNLAGNAARAAVAIAKYKAIDVRL